MAETLSEHEVIIVGGGPAGATAAWELVKNGVDCLILDREAFPREKLCAGWITPEVVRDLEFVPEDYPYRFLTFDVLNISIKGLKLPFRAPQHSIRRFEFDRWLVERSGAPVTIHNVRHVVADENGFIIDDKFRCRYLIGAGGTRCPVYRDLFRSLQPRAKELQVVTQELEYPCQYEDGNCYLWFFTDGLPGYGWYVPKADGYVNVGVGGVANKLRRKGDDIKRHWQALIDRLIKTGLINVPPGQPGGYSYFLRAKADITHQGNAYLIGDATGLATRDMCEGIGPAVQSGLMAARAIHHKTTFDLAQVDAHTLGPKIVYRALDYAFTGNRA
ncbi:MAG: FAD-dependent monooxygenase [Gammaproteobacteria bacterium]|nr:FAD-dependent monooxygenase [Gammaproteobacteria bacterium]